MKPVYVQHLLKVLLEEYQDIDYMLDTMVATHPSRQENEKVRRLLSQLSYENDKLLDKFDAVQAEQAVPAGQGKLQRLKSAVKA